MTSPVSKGLFVFALFLLVGVAVIAGRPTEGWAGSTGHVTTADFGSRVLEAGRPVVVQFDASWCPFCRKVRPYIDALASRKGGAVDVYRLDVDASKAVASYYQVQSLPTIIIFVDGDEYARYEGAPEQQELFDWVDEMTSALAPAEDDDL
jgi:thioredoxin 1